MNNDLGHSFSKLVGSMYEVIEGCRCEKLPDGKYKWGNVVGTKSEIQKAIIEAGVILKNSIKK